MPILGGLSRKNEGGVVPTYRFVQLIGASANKLFCLLTPSFCRHLLSPQALTTAWAQEIYLYLSYADSSVEILLEPLPTAISMLHTLVRRLAINGYLSKVLMNYKNSSKFGLDCLMIYL